MWSSRFDRLERPDRLIFDLDPARGDGDWPLVTRTARELIALLEELGVTRFAMTSGSRGVHVVVPLRRRYGFDRVQEAAHGVLPSARAFTLRDVPGRLERDGDPWAAIARAAGRLPTL